MAPNRAESRRIARGARHRRLELAEGAHHKVEDAGDPARRHERGSRQTDVHGVDRLVRLLLQVRGEDGEARGAPDDRRADELEAHREPAVADFVEVVRLVESVDEA